MADSPATFQPMTGDKPTQFRYIIYSVGTYTSYATQTSRVANFGRPITSQKCVGWNYLHGGRIMP